MKSAVLEARKSSRKKHNPSGFTSCPWPRRITNCQLTRGIGLQKLFEAVFINVEREWITHNDATSGFFRHYFHLVQTHLLAANGNHKRTNKRIIKWCCDTPISSANRHMKMDSFIHWTTYSLIYSGLENKQTSHLFSSTQRKNDCLQTHEKLVGYCSLPRRPLVKG